MLECQGSTDLCGQRWSFAELQTEIDRTARACIALGMQAGDRVALWMPNRSE
jgi:fatty-acyl-CoA synthase